MPHGESGALDVEYLINVIKVISKLKLRTMLCVMCGKLNYGNVLLARYTTILIPIDRIILYRKELTSLM